MVNVSFSTGWIRLKSHVINFVIILAYKSFHQYTWRTTALGQYDFHGPLQYIMCRSTTRGFLIGATRFCFSIKTLEFIKLWILSLQLRKWSITISYVKSYRANGYHGHFYTYTLLSKFSITLHVRTTMVQSYKLGIE